MITLQLDRDCAEWLYHRMVHEAHQAEVRRRMANQQGKPATAHAYSASAQHAAAIIGALRPHRPQEDPR